MNLNPGGVDIHRVDSAALRALSEEGLQQMRGLFETHGTITLKCEYGQILKFFRVSEQHKQVFRRIVAKHVVKKTALETPMGMAKDEASRALYGHETGLEKLVHASGVDKFVSGVDKFVRWLVSLIVDEKDVEAVSKILRTLLPDFVKEVTASVTPLLGIVMPIVSAGNDYGKALKKKLKQQLHELHRKHIYAGVEADQAILAMNSILEREFHDHVFNATSEIVEFGGKFVTGALDAGTATTIALGLGASVVRWLNMIRIIHRDVQEVDKANRMIHNGRVDFLRLFEACPLAGSYYICCAPTSLLMSEILKRFGDVGWMNTTERAAAKHLAPLKLAAKTTIQNHRFEIIGLKEYPGVMPKNAKEAKHIRSFVGPEYRSNLPEKINEAKRRCVENYSHFFSQDNQLMNADI